jgi:excisionase family DNA binding protein
MLGMSSLEISGLLDPQAHPTLTVPQAGIVLGLAKASAYEAAHRGELPTIRVGRRLLVPTAALRRMLQIDEPASPRRPLFVGDGTRPV